MSDGSLAILGQLFGASVDGGIDGMGQAAIEPYLSAIQVQINVSVGLCAFGFAAILVTWARVLRLVQGSTAVLRSPTWLIAPLIVFGISSVADYAVRGYVAGYQKEMVLGYDTSKYRVCISKGRKNEECRADSKIRDPLKHLIDRYIPKFDMYGAVQWMSALLGLLLLSLWYVVNVYMWLRIGQTPQVAVNPQGNQPKLD